jgi:hypothetical protein
VKPQVTDAGLEHIKGLTQLRTLDLTQTKVTGTGLEHLKGLTQLQTLKLLGIRSSDFMLRAFWECGDLSPLSSSVAAGAVPPASPPGMRERNPKR